MRRTSNLDLKDLPSDDEFVEAVRRIIRENEEDQQRARDHGFWYHAETWATANAVAHVLGVEGARRAGNGAVKGSWSGYMSGALRTAPRLQSLARRGLILKGRDDQHRWVYAAPEQEAGLRTTW